MRSEGKKSDCLAFHGRGQVDGEFTRDRGRGKDRRKRED